MEEINISSTMTNPYMVFLVMTKEKCTYKEELILIERAMANLKI